MEKVGILFSRTDKSNTGEGEQKRRYHTFAEIPTFADTRWKFALSSAV
jgi:hypothetical protein